MTEVTQTDRECAVRIMADRWNAKHRAGVLAGEHDNWIPVQEVAKHRINHTRPASTEPADTLAEAGEALELAYGLLWHMKIDNKDINLKLASDARKALLAAIGKEGQLRGIDAAKMTDARFTGAA